MSDIIAPRIISDNRVTIPIDIIRKYDKKEGDRIVLEVKENCNGE
jgi:bifunctional DNA-binding transcriptional regulator/antitoxin component of YhaV-PrlF toxin-antitoxin module